jgi:hypothetical protein
MSGGQRHPGNRDAGKILKKKGPGPSEFRHVLSKSLESTGFDTVKLQSYYRITNLPPDAKVWWSKKVTM